MEKFDISLEEEKKLKDKIKRFFKDKREEEIGDLASEIVLDFILEKMAPVFYNKGIEDARTFVNLKLEDIYEIEKRVE